MQARDAPVVAPLLQTLARRIVTQGVHRMYVPSQFEEADIGMLQKYIREYGFGLLVVADDDGIEANHVPFYFSLEGNLYKQPITPPL